MLWASRIVLTILTDMYPFRTNSESNIYAIIDYQRDLVGFGDFM